MGLIKAGMGAIGGVLADQWKEYFYCDSMTPDVLMCKGQKRTSSQGRSSNTSGEDNIISNGSVIAVNVGQCMMIVEQGKVVDLCAEPGEYTYDKSTEPSVFTGDLKESVIQVFQRMGKRFTFGGDTGKDQRVYYFNTKEIIGNKYGTPAEIPFKVIEENTGRSLLVRIRCFGEYSYKIVDPILFYSTIAGNAPDQYLRSQWDSQLKSELLTALQPAFGKISAQRIDYTELPMRTMELADALNDVLSSKWRDLRGIEIVSFGVNSVKANEEDEAKLQKVQMGAMMSNPEMRMGVLTDATADGIRNASANESGMGPMGAFIVGGIGAFLGDFFFYPAPMFVSLVTHGLQAVVISLVARRFARGGKGGQWLAVSLGAVIMVVGYSLGRAYVYSTPEYAMLKLPYQILLLVITAVNGIVDGLFASNIIGNDGMSAIGLYGPMNHFL